MSNYETLDEMGIQNPDEISKYTLRQEGHGDVLKIYYKRKKGSFLPNSRKYKFGRSVKTIRSESGDQGYEDVYEISPFLQKALAELDSIVQHKHDVADTKQDIIEEMEHLERVMTHKMADLRAKLEKL